MSPRLRDAPSRSAIDGVACRGAAVARWNLASANPARAAPPTKAPGLRRAKASVSARSAGRLCRRRSCARSDAPPAMMPSIRPRSDPVSSAACARNLAAASRALSAMKSRPASACALSSLITFSLADPRTSRASSWVASIASAPAAFRVLAASSTVSRILSCATSTSCHGYGLPRLGLRSQRDLGTERGPSRASSRRGHNRASLGGFDPGVQDRGRRAPEQGTTCLPPALTRHTRTRSTAKEKDHARLGCYVPRHRADRGGTRLQRYRRRLCGHRAGAFRDLPHPVRGGDDRTGDADRKSTRLNSSHVKISYAVFCLKK